MLSRLRSLASAALRRGRFEDAMSEEIRAHLATYADDLERSGVPRDEALRRARLEFGGIERVKDECRQARGLRWIDELQQDLRFALRQMTRNPGFAAAAILSLALGIGANTAIFSMMDAVLLRTLPVEDPPRLYFLAHGAGDDRSLSSNYPLLERYRGLGDFTGITAYDIEQFKVSTDAGSELVMGQFVSGNYHALLGVPLLLGRGFASEADQPTARSLIAVIGERYWTRRFGRDPQVIGRTLHVEGRTVTVVGVTPAGFHGLSPGTNVEITLPLSMKVMDRPGFLDMQDTWTSLTLVARLHPDVSAARALASVDAALRQYLSEPEQAWLRRDGRTPDAFRVAQLVPAGRGTDDLRTRYDRSLLVLMAMVGVVLLIACANVANLMLVRASARTREVAVRMGLGAGRARLVRQFLTESLLLALGGGALGLLVSVWATRVIVSLFSAGPSAAILDVGQDGRVLAFTTTISVLTAIAFGLVPALRATRLDVTPALKDNAGSLVSGRRRPAAGKALAVCQIALTVLLLAATGLLVRTLLELKGLDAGFRKENVLLFSLDTRGSDARVTELYGPLLERVRALPGVRTASFSTASPLATDLEIRGIDIPDLPLASGIRSAVTNRITPDYLSTLGIRVVRGRAFTAHDSANAPRVALVSETMARQYFGGSDPVGRTFRFPSVPEDLVTIVGLVGDVRQRDLREPPPRMMYAPLAQAEEPPESLTGAVRTAQDPRSIESAVRAAVSEASPDLVLSEIRTIEEQLDASLVRERVLATLSTGFGMLSLVLACVGVYGVMAYGVARRTREIGIRMALGAGRAVVLRRVLGETLAMTAGGLAIGLLAALALTRLLSTFLFGLSARDPLTLAAAAVVLLGTTLLAGFVPARRAASVDPAAVLKAE